MGTIIELSPEQQFAFCDLLEEDIIEFWLSKTGWSHGLPCSTRALLNMSAALGFDIAPRTIEVLLREESIETPPRKGIYAWELDNVRELLAYLYHRKRFVPGFFESVKGEKERQRDAERVMHGLRLREYYAGLDVDELRRRYGEETESPSREMIASVLREKLTVGAH